MKKTLTLSLLLAAFAVPAANAALERTESITVAGNSYGSAEGAVEISTGNDKPTTGDTAADYFAIASGRVNITSAESIPTGTTLIAAACTNGETSHSGGQLYLNRWSGSAILAGDLVLTNNIILGAAESGGDVKEYALRFNDTNQNSKIILKGTVDVVQNTNVAVNTLHNYIEGAINGTGMNMHVDTSYNTGSAGTLYLSGGATLQTLSGRTAIVLDDKKADGTTGAASTSYTMVNAIGTGALTVDAGVMLTLLGHASDEALQTTSKSIVNSNGKAGSKTNGINIGTADTSNTVILKNAQNYGAVNILGDNTLRIDAEGAVSGHFDLNGDGTKRTGTMIVGGKAKVTTNTDLWFNSNCEIDIEDGGQLKRDILIINTQAGKTATLRKSGDGGANLAAGADSITLTNAALTIQHTGSTDIALKLVDSSLINNGTGTVLDKQAANTSYVAIDAKNGDMYFANKANGISVKELTMAEGRTVGVYVNEAKTTQASLTVTGSLTADSSSTIKSSMLTLTDGVTLDFASSVTLVGELTLYSNLVLTDGMLGEDGVTLFTGVTGLNLASGAYTAPVDAALVFAGLDAGAYNLVFSNNEVSLQSALQIPEPATATLSLLALAGLAARRRRK